MLVAEFLAEIGRIAETLERDAGALDRLEARLALLGDLRRKYGDSLTEVLAFGERTALRVAELEDLFGALREARGRARPGVRSGRGRGPRASGRHAASPVPSLRPVPSTTSATWASGTPWSMSS